MRAIPIDELISAEERFPAAARTFDWNRIVAEGRAAREAADGGAWRIGALALLVERRYASGALKRFAEAIGETHGTVRRLRWVAGAYGDDARARFSSLSFSHFQAVAGLSDRLLWLERAQRNSWSVERLAAYSRGVEKPSKADGARYRRPVDAAVRQMTRLAKLDRRELAKGARAGLGEALDELAEQVEALRTRVRAANATRLRPAGGSKPIAPTPYRSKAASRARRTVQR